MILEREITEINTIKITDIFGRTFKTLRVSLTNTCNLACTYCIDPLPPTPKGETKDTLPLSPLGVGGFIKIIGALNNILEFDTLRLTGGEPLLYKQIIPLIKGVKDLGISEIKMTSNATLLSSKAKDLQNVGLTSINISLDAIDPGVSFNINQRTKLQKILEGIDKSIEAGMQVKINCVVMKGVNDHQIIKLLNYCKGKNITIRFLELMQMGHLYHNFEQLFFSEKEILKIISTHYNIIELPRNPNATANYWMTDTDYKFGIISNVSDPFCNDCNRLRLDSYGNIYGCLSDNNPINILDCIDDEVQVKEKLMQALSQKKTKFSGSELSMLHIGG
jgi:cyclic pyranopterin phosphate synthase